MKHYQYLIVLLILLAGSPAWSANLVESGNKLQMADNILTHYLIPLKLEGKAGSYSLEKMINERFRCSLAPISLIGLDIAPRLVCIKQPSGYAPLCDDLYVTLWFDKMSPPLPPTRCSEAWIR